MKKLFTLAVVAIGINSIAQNPNPQTNALWQAEGSDTVKTDRFVKMNNSASVKGQITTDSAHF